MLIAALRDKGQHPCPHCLVTFKEIPQVGTEEDRRVRIESARKDDGVRNSLVDEARRLIYGQGYSVTSDKVEDLLKAISAVPTVVRMRQPDLFADANDFYIEYIFKITS